VFFFEPETIRKIFFKKKEAYVQNEIQIPSYKNAILFLGGVYFLIQFALPLRHHFIEGDVLWTEEGHRLSWRMMLRSRTGTIKYTVINTKTRDTTVIKLDDYLTAKQKRRVRAYPDFIWQFAQHLKNEYAENGEDIAVSVNSKASVNGRPYSTFIDPKIDLANTPWIPFAHHDWISSSGFRK
jgi:hypothetical protein